MLYNRLVWLGDVLLFMLAFMMSIVMSYICGKMVGHWWGHLMGSAIIPAVAILDWRFLRWLEKVNHARYPFPQQAHNMTYLESEVLILFELNFFIGLFCVILFAKRI